MCKVGSPSLNIMKHCFPRELSLRGPMSHYWLLLRDILTITVAILGETETFENFGGHHCLLSGQFCGSLEANRGQKAYFLCVIKVQGDLG